MLTRAVAGELASWVVQLVLYSTTVVTVNAVPRTAQ